MCCKLLGAAFLLVFLVMGALVSFPEMFFNAAARMFYANTAQKDADALVILAGWPSSRLPRAVMAIKEGYSYKVIITDTQEKESVYPDIFKTQKRVVQEVLEREKIPARYLQNHNGGVTSTFDEAYDVAAYCKQHRLARIILVTDAFHSGRALYAFQKVFKLTGTDTIVQVLPTRNREQMRDWFKTESGWVTVFMEVLKTLYYRFASTNIGIVKAD